MKITGEMRQTMLRQIGVMNVLAICGGAMEYIANGIDMKVGYGYWVRVEYIWGADTYRVGRVFKRAGNERDCGTRENIYADELGNIAYYASCFRNDSGTEWTYLG